MMSTLESAGSLRRERNQETMCGAHCLFTSCGRCGFFGGLGNVDSLCDTCKLWENPMRSLDADAADAADAADVVDAAVELLPQKYCRISTGEPFFYLPGQ